MANTRHGGVRLVRRDESDPALEPGASFTVAPLTALGWDRVSVFLRLPKGGAILELQQGLRGGALATTNAIRMRGAGSVAAEYPRGGEVIGIVFKNGKVAQRPHLLVSLGRNG